MSILTVNGVTDDDLGLAFTGIGALWSGPSVSRSRTGVMGRYGVVPGLVASGSEKRIPATLKLSGTVATRRANFNTVMRHLDGLLYLEWSDQPTLMQWATVDVVEARALFESQAYVLGELALGIEFVVDSGVYFSKAIFSAPVSTTAERYPLGTLPSAPFIRVSGATSNLTLTVKHGLTNATITTLTLSGTTAAGTVLEIDCARETLYTWDTTTGAKINRLTTTNLYSSGDFPVLDPGWGTEAYPPTLESNHTGTVLYRKYFA